MRFRIRRDRFDQLHLEEQRLDDTQRQYWYDHGLFESAVEAEEYAEGVKVSRDAEAAYNADVAAGRDIVFTFDL